MEPSRPAIRFELTARSVVVVLAILFGMWLLFKLWFVLVMVVIALILAGTLKPLVEWLEKRKVPRTLALGIVFTGMAAILVATCLLTIPPLVTQLASIMERLPAMQGRLADWLQQNKFFRPLAASVKNARLAELMAIGGQYLLDYGSKVVIMIGEAVTIVFLALYFLSGREHEQGALFAVIPRRYHLRTARIMLNLETIVGGYVRGQLITSAAIAVFVFALLTLMGVDNALAIALFAALTDVIPFIGGIIASTPVVLATLPKGIPASLGVLGAMIVYQEIESRILVPRVYGRVLRLSPVAVLLALLVGGTLMGILGALLALPVAAAIRMAINVMRVGMPGDDTDDTKIRKRDEAAEREFAHRAAGESAGSAAAIATQMAEDIRDGDAPGNPAAASDVPVTGGESDRPV